MGIRIAAFAIDVIALDALLRQPLWRVLVDLRHAPPGEHVMFHVWKTGDRYLIANDRRLVHGFGKPRYAFRNLTDDEAAADPQLHEPLHEYLPTQSSFALKFLLHDLTHVHRAQFIHEVSDGHRRWWIGSLLATAHQLWHDTPPFTELSGYLARVLRGRNCYFPLKPHEQLTLPRDFPVAPNDDGDPGMAAFDESESRRLLELLDMLMQCSPVFGRPPLDPINDDVAWNEWVRELVGQFLAFRNADIPNMHFVTFIG